MPRYDIQLQSAIQVIESLGVSVSNFQENQARLAEAFDRLDRSQERFDPLDQLIFPITGQFGSTLYRDGTYDFELQDLWELVGLSNITINIYRHDWRGDRLFSQTTEGSVYYDLDYQRGSTLLRVFNDCKLLPTRTRKRAENAFLRKHPGLVINRAL